MPLDYPYQFDGSGRTAMTGEAAHVREELRVPRGEEQPEPALPGLGRQLDPGEVLVQRTVRVAEVPRAIAGVQPRPRPPLV